MLIKEIMTPHPKFLFKSASISEAAEKMRELDTGFLPIGDKSTDKLVGTITDRDIVISAIAGHKNIDSSVEEVMHKGVFYCYEQDDIKDAIQKMKTNKIRRLIVLNDQKKLSGIVSLGDIALNCKEELSGEALEEISRH